jgi:GT2 family glycosyltransferase
MTAACGFAEQDAPIGDVSIREAASGRTDMTQRIGIIAIGRNEGERLRACLRSVVGDDRLVVYVDSGSTDGSVEMAQAMGAEVVALDLTKPFTAARARNAGFQRLAELDPQVEFVQFVDGDCEVVSGWIARATGELSAKPQAAVVCGRRREQHPEATLYNRLCDIEWDTPVGEAKACGGDAMIRAAAFREVGGYDPSVIAGEEPEMCVRLRAKGWRIFRVDAEMTLHDAAMTRFGQWWKRNVRAGHAYAEGTAMHGRPPERHGVKQVWSNWVWGMLVPALILALAWPLPLASAVLLLAYPLMWARIYRGERRRGRTVCDARVHSMFVLLGKIPQALGQLKFVWSRLRGKRSTLIEYKGGTGRGSAIPVPR